MKTLLVALLVAVSVSSVWSQDALIRKYYDPNVELNGVKGKYVKIPNSEIKAWLETLDPMIVSALRGTAQFLEYGSTDPEMLSKYDVGYTKTWSDQWTRGYTLNGEINCEDYSVLMMRYLINYKKDKPEAVQIRGFADANHNWIWIEGVGNIEPQLLEGNINANSFQIIQTLQTYDTDDTWIEYYCYRIRGDKRWTDYRDNVLKDLVAREQYYEAHNKE
jgi:hypothetical protein